MAQPFPLGVLVAPLSAAEFVRDHWGKRPYLGKAPAQLLAWLLDELAGGDVGKLVSRYRPPIAVWCRTLDGIYRSINVATASEAMALYDCGQTLFLNNGASTPAITLWQKQLAEELGHPAVTPAASLFCARRSAGTQPHFDSLENITIQLRGRKRWRVAPNPSVELPLENWSTGQEVSPSLASTLTGKLPSAMPDDAETFDLTEGSLLYTPRGWFHETTTSDDSLQMFLGFPVASWIDLLLDGMRTHLARLPDWRENVIGGWSSAERVQAARRRLDELRARLPADLEGLSTACMVPGPSPDLGTVGDARALRRNPLASMRVVERPRLTLTVTVHLGKLASSRSLHVSEHLAPLVTWLAARVEPFTAEQAAGVVPMTPRPALTELLGALQVAGYLTTV
jgi:50S ribosomal protein L16 3-hydroxylase